MERFIAFIKLLCSPRRSFAYRVKEAECAELKDRVAKLEAKIEELNGYILFNEGRPGLHEAKPKQRGLSTPIIPNRLNRAEMDKKYQARIEGKIKNDKTGLPNEFLPLETDQIS
jgi:hypothetical protein